LVTSLAGCKTPKFQNCIIDTSDNVNDGMNYFMQKIIEEAITTTDPDIIENYARNQPVIPVSRQSNEPVIEWSNNKTLLTGAFLDK
jgi:hypothetical protein